MQVNDFWTNTETRESKYFFYFYKFCSSTTTVSFNFVGSYLSDTVGPGGCSICFENKERVIYICGFENYLFIKWVYQYNNRLEQSELSANESSHRRYNVQFYSHSDTETTRAIGSNYKETEHAIFNIIYYNHTQFYEWKKKM